MAHIQTVAIFGAAGNVGSGITAALLARPDHPANLIAVVREASTSTFPSGVTVRRADFASRASLATALAGVDAVVITLPITAGTDMQIAIIDAASDAGVKYVVPNEFGSDTAHPAVQEIIINASKAGVLRHAEEKGITWFAMVTNPWYEYAFDGLSFGLDLKNRTAALWDDGTQKTRLSSLAGPGKAVAALLSSPKSATTGASLDKYANSHVYVSDLYVSQHDILASIQRAMGTTDADWTVTYSPLRAVIERGKKMFADGDFSGMLFWLYGLMFEKGAGQYEGRHVANEDLGVPPADLDALSRAVVEKKRAAGEI